MKLRIFDDSIRLRLSRTEVGRVAKGETIESTCRFPGGESLTYALGTADAEALSARFHDHRLEVTIPRERAARWAASEQVSLRGDVRTRGVFRILVEKDFTCIEPREHEDQSDLYPNPKARRRRALAGARDEST